ncbi:MAG: acetyl-CoA hydrolase/transferase family protein [Bacteroidales bacterium]|nr:acetyl-CoA hydrolase/transferase family protein [Bacteroidales bacterium]
MEKLHISTMSAADAVKLVQSGDRLHWPCVSAAPEALIRALVERAPELQNVHITHLYTEGYADYVLPQYAGTFQLDSFFIGGNVRKATQAGYADYIPCSLSDTAKMIEEGYQPVDGVFVMVSEPDDEGYVSLGTSVDCTLAAIRTARYVVAQVNRYMPYCHGDARIPVSKITAFVRHDVPLIEAEFPALSEQDIAIGKHAAALIPDGATLQIGIGNIPNAVLAQLTSHQHLGIHSEMFSDGVLPLIESGVIDGSRKKLDVGVHVATFLKGTRRLYDFVDHNPSVHIDDVAYTNNPAVIASNPKVVALNSAIQIDLTGQVCADSIGTTMFSGSGGQLDFMLGAGASEGGIPIVAMPSITGKGVSKIVPTLAEGAGVVTPRTVVHWVVTEFGAVNLYGKPLKERARLLTSIAHPSAREALEKAAYDRFCKKSF